MRVLAGVFGLRGADVSERAAALGSRLRESGVQSSGMASDRESGRHIFWSGRDAPRAAAGQPAAALRFVDRGSNRGVHVTIADASSRFELPAHDASFCGVTFDAHQHTLTLASDALGSVPLYWALDDDAVIVSSTVRWLLAARKTRPVLNRAAVADFVTFGFPMGTKTTAEGVELLPPGSVVTISLDSGRVHARRGEDVAAWFGAGGRPSDYAAHVSAAFKEAVQRAAADDGGIGLALSGGLDSRAILSAMRGTGITPITYTLGVGGCADEVIADELAALAGTNHRFFELDARYLRDYLPNLRELIGITDGMYLSHGLTEMLAVRFLGELHVSTLVRGHGGELAKTDLAWPLHTDATVADMTSVGQLVPYLLRRANYTSRDVDMRELFAAGWADEICSTPEQSLRAALDVPLSPLDACSYLYLMEHHRRYTNASLELFRQTVDVTLPFVDPAFLRVLFSGPAACRRGTALHRAIISTHDPRLGRVRNSNTGAPADAGPVVEAVLDKVNSVFKRLGLRGYRHYHAFDAWMRNSLLESVGTILLDEQSLDRGMLREAGLRALIDATRAGRADHSYLLQVLLILELWQRQEGV